MYYILDENKLPIPADPETFTHFFNDINKRQVAYTDIKLVYVSTVFLGIDHNFSTIGPPILFESMVFSKEGFLSIDMRRYTTWDKAEAGHSDLVTKWEKIENNIKMAVDDLFSRRK